MKYFAATIACFFFLCSNQMVTLLYSQTETGKTLRIYSTLYEPTEHPDYERHHIKAPGWKTFDNETQLICLRGFPQQNNVGQDFDKTIDLFAKNGLGRVIWPSWNTIYFSNLDELANVIKQRDLYLFDFWGYVPGSGEYHTGNDFWLQFRADPGQFRILEETLGERWLGMDNGEQDGRYIGGYAPAMYPISNNRMDQYLRFQRHFEQLADDLGNRLATLVSLNFGHYYLKEGIYTLIGAETAQALPNSQVYYSYIRGAGKQYGVLWFGNASVYNRWGWKSYPTENSDHGPTKGTSLSLLKRLMYSHILYNSAAVGFENGWFVGEELAPIGKIQQSAGTWMETNGSPGVMMTNVALLDDFHSGWSFPRHLYTDNTYRVWGNIPYGPGDFLNNNILGMIYPRYQDSSYFHDETGFLTETPYSDATDCLLSDAPSWLLERYPLIIVSGELKGGMEIKNKLTDYVANGGRLVMTAGNLKALQGFLEANVSPTPPRVIKNGHVVFENQQTEEMDFSLQELILPTKAKIVAMCEGLPVVAEISHGKGSVVLLASPFGLGEQPITQGKIPNRVDIALANPYPLLTHVRYVLDQELQKTVLFDVGAGLGSIVCRKGPGHYTIGVFNNTLGELPFKITSRIGKIKAIKELPLDVSERTAIGFLPSGFEDSKLGKHTDATIAGADVRIFDVQIEEAGIQEIPHHPLPQKISGRYLPLRKMTPIKEEILARPTFFEHYDGVMIDWRYLSSRSDDAVFEESKWLKLQNLKVVVDFSSGINLFPDLRLIQNDAAEYEKSMKVFLDVLSKAAVIGADHAILAVHRVPENNYTSEQSRSDTIATLQELCRFAREKGMTISLRISNNQQMASLNAGLSLLNEVKEDNFKLAPHLWSIANEKDSAAIDSMKQHFSFILVAAPLRDVGGNIWTIYSPFSKCRPEDRQSINLLDRYADIPVINDAVYETQEEEYLDVLIQNRSK